MEVRVYGHKTRQDKSPDELTTKIRGAVAYEKLRFLVISHLPKMSRDLIDIKTYTNDAEPIGSFVEVIPLEGETFNEKRVIERISEIMGPDAEIIICSPVRVYVGTKPI